VFRPLTGRRAAVAGATLTALAAVAAAVVLGRASADAATVALPPANAKADYQLGGAYPPPSGVRVVSRDRTARPAPGLYNICYVNAFQTQPDDADWWKKYHNDLLLKDSSGDYVIDGDWNEMLLDVRTAAKRTALASIVGGWIDGCSASGFKAVEPDNLDSYTRSEGLMTKSQAMAFAKLLIGRAHARNLAIAQKNTAELGDAGRAAGFDFAVAEECGHWDECDSYTDPYGDHVIVIEYTRSDFNKACGQWGASLSVILRDRNVTPPGSGSYVYAAC
jgi:hypothetical protein